MASEAPPPAGESRPIGSPTVTWFELFYDLVVVANRLPVAAETDEDGAVRWVRSPGGLVSSMEPALRDSRAIWVGWSGRVSSEDDVDVPVPQSLGPCALREVPLTATQVELYYEGFCNATLWPLYHDAIATPVYHRHMWDAYVEVNRAFAAQAAEVAGGHPVLLDRFLDDGEASLAIVIPRGFGDQAAARRPAVVQLIIDGT